MKLKNWGKQSLENYKPTEDHISNMSKAMDSIVCNACYRCIRFQKMMYSLKNLKNILFGK